MKALRNGMYSGYRIDMISSKITSAENPKINKPYHQTKGGIAMAPSHQMYQEKLLAMRKNPAERVPNKTTRSPTLSGIFLKIEAHHCLPYNSIYKIFPAKGPGRLTTFSGPLKGGCKKQCLEHSVVPGAISCSFQLQESSFLNKLEFYGNLPEECWMISASIVRETAKIDAGGVKKLEHITKYREWGA